MMNVKIRNAKVEDTESILLLSNELGYYPTKSEIENRILKFASGKVEEIFVAELTSVVGWMHIALVEPLESKAFVEIRGIVVNHKFRYQGIGTKLIQYSENWARKKGCNKIRIRTNINRGETRKYYSKLNFLSKKTQEVFEKILS